MKLSQKEVEVHPVEELQVPLMRRRSRLEESHEDYNDYTRPRLHILV
jgi:hypothetical protein